MTVGAETGKIGAVASLEPGQQIGDYRLLRRLGSGAFAEVWAAVDAGALGFRKRVALKLLKGLQDAPRDRMESLVNEARLGGHLHHPHIVDVYGVGEADGLWYIAMELVEGRTLADLIEIAAAHRIQLPRAVVIDIVQQIAAALEHAHSVVDDAGRPLKVTHRDLKPANVLLSVDAGVKVADFGLAKATTNVASTAAGLTKGTPCYLAPEAWRGQRDFGPVVDLFALGAILYELIVGHRLFMGDTMATVAYAIMDGDPLAEVKPVAPLFPEVVPMLRRMLERDPTRRLQRAEQVVFELDQIRAATRPAGSLALFLRLLDASSGPPSAALSPIPGFELPRSDEPGWARLGDVAQSRMEAMRAPDRPPTLDALATRRVGLAELEAALASPATAPAKVAQKEPERPERVSAALVSTQAYQPAAGEVTAASPSLCDVESDAATEDAHVATPRGRGARRARGGRARGRAPARPSRGSALRWGVVSAISLLAAATVLVALRGPAVDAQEAPGAPSPPDDLPVDLTFDELDASTAPRQQEAAPHREPVKPRRPESNDRGSKDEGSPTSPTVEPSEEIGANSVPEDPVVAAEVEAETPTTTVSPPADAPRPTRGCVVFRSSPIGGKVWLDSTLQDRAAGRTNAFSLTLEPGPKLVEMAMATHDRPTQSAKIYVQSGVRQIVTCTLGGSADCAVAVAPGGCP